MCIVYVMLCATVLLSNHLDTEFVSAREVFITGLFPLACGAAWMVWVGTVTVVDDS